MSKRGYTPTKPTSIPTPPKATDTASFRPTPSLRLIRPALQLLKSNLVTITCVLIIPSFLPILGAALVGDFKTIGTTTIVGILLILLSGIWLFFNAAAVYYAQLRIMRGESPGVIDCYRNSFRFLPRLYGLVFLLVTITIATAIAIFPIFVFLRRYVLAPYFLIDDDTGIRVAMQRSAAATQPYQRSIWGTLLVGLLITGCGLLAAYLLKSYGLVITAAISSVTSLMIGLRYKELGLHQAAVVNTPVKQ